MNRAAKQCLLFETPADYQAFERLLVEARAKFPMRILAYCLMPTHVHLLLWPFQDGDLTRFVKWLLTTHAARWNTFHGTVGRGAVYQSRFKSIPISTDFHLWQVWKYVERNPVQAKLVARAEDWKWSSLRLRQSGQENDLLAQAPAELPINWIDVVNTPANSDLAEVRQHIASGVPYGLPKPRAWAAKRMADPANTTPVAADCLHTKNRGQTPYYA